MKFLIGVTPLGVISFVSKAWGGRTPDKHLTENCGVMKYLLPGDVILADRGFDIEDSDAHFGATVEIPAFTKYFPMISGNTPFLKTISAFSTCVFQMSLSCITRKSSSFPTGYKTLAQYSMLRQLCHFVCNKDTSR